MDIISPSSGYDHGVSRHISAPTSSNLTGLDKLVEWFQGVSRVINVYSYADLDRPEKFLADILLFSVRENTDELELSDSCDLRWTLKKTNQEITIVDEKSWDKKQSRFIHSRLKV